MDQVLGFGPVAQNSPSYGKNGPRIAHEENAESLAISRLNLHQQMLVVWWRRNSCRFADWFVDGFPDNDVGVPKSSESEKEKW